MEIRDNILIKVKNEDIVNGTFIIPDSVTKIGREAFMHCTFLKSITIPNGVTEIDAYAFNGCRFLEKIEIPNSVTKIEMNAFGGCASLKSIIIPNGVTKIDEYAFYECTSLESITISDSVKKIGKGAFDDCTSLKSITIPNSVEKIEKFTFDTCISLKSITIPNSVTKIEVNAFRCCTSLKNIEIPNSIKKLSYDDLYRCDSLNLNILTSLFYLVGQSDIDDFFSVKSITIYGQKMDKSNFKQKLDNIRRKELLDKIITYFINNNILDIKHYKYSLHRNFIESVIKKYSDITEYYYKDDFNKYMEDYINKNHLRKEIIDKEIDDILTSINDSIKNHSIEELDTSSSVNIINYGEELLKMTIKIDDVLSKIIDNYGPTNTILEKELKKFRSPRNIVQYLDNINDQEEKIYLGKNSIDFLIYCNNYNLYRLNLGIKKLKELQSILKMYEEKLNGYKNNLVNYKSISIDENELHKMDDLSIEKQIEDKINSYTNQVILTNKVYNGVQNQIDMYQIYMDMLEKSRMLLEQIKDGEFTNKGVITDEEIVKPLNELLGFYENVDTKNGKKSK